MVFFIWCDTVVTLSFNSLIVVYFSSLNIFIIAILKSFSDSDIWLQSQAVSVDYFCPVGSYFPVSLFLDTEHCR